jgi:hypothetical protein
MQFKMLQTNFDSRMPPSVVYFGHILNVTALESRVNVTVQLQTFAQFTYRKMAFTMQTSTDNVGIFINLVHDYNTRDKLQESCNKKTFRTMS